MSGGARTSHAEDADRLSDYPPEGGRCRESRKLLRKNQIEYLPHPFLNLASRSTDVISVHVDLNTVPVISNDSRDGWSLAWMRWPAARPRWAQ